MSVSVMRAAHALGNAYLLHHIIFPILEKDSLEMVSGEIFAIGDVCFAFIISLSTYLNTLCPYIQIE